MLKKIVKGVAGLIIMAVAVGCSSEHSDYHNVAGYAEAAKAKTLHSQLDSGHIRVVDNATGETTEEFTFMYLSDGSLMYSYMGVDGDTVRYEFHNGSEINYRKSGDDHWSLIDQSSGDYFVFTHTYPHPCTAESAIAINAYAVADSKIEDTEDGEKVTFYYDAAKLADTLSDIGELDSFESTLWLNEEGYCYRLDQRAVLDGGESVSDFSMFIDRMNEVSELTLPDIQ